MPGERGTGIPEITGWIRANQKDLKRVQEMGLKETGILTSVSDYHIFLKLNKRRKQVFEEYLDVVRAALEMKIIPRCHFEDVTRADIYGFCVPFAQALMRLREESGVDIKIRLCDTMGYGVTYPGAALPRAVDKLVRAMIDDAGVPGELLEWHGHNDFHKVLINAAYGLALWLRGGQWRDFRFRGTDRQYAPGRPDHRIYRPAGRFQRGRHHRDHGHRANTRNGRWA